MAEDIYKIIPLRKKLLAARWFLIKLSGSFALFYKRAKAIRIYA